MKNLMKVTLLVLFVLTLSGCDLAKSPEPSSNIDLYTEEDSINYIPSGIEFRVFEGDMQQSEIDVTDYFYVSFNCREANVWDDCRAMNYGKSIESSGTTFHTQSTTINGVKEADVETTSIELTFYALHNSDLSIYSTFLLESEDGDIKRENQAGTDFVSGLTISGDVKGKGKNGASYILEYIFHYRTIDELQMLTVKEFDKDDTLLVETKIAQMDLLESLLLNEETQYYFIIEDYIDEEGIPYQERIYNDASTPYYYLYKYCNEHGFLNGDVLAIN